jgi:4-amino-4-deoxy-L-arabinose transferase-like glycosyltransferase
VIELDAESAGIAKTAPAWHSLAMMIPRLRDRLPELTALLLGALLRISMATTYDVTQGFDFETHWVYADYIARHGALPPLVLNAESYHPPLYYLLVAGLIKLGLGTGAVGWLAALLGIGRLIVVWIGLERWLPESRLARVVALFTASVLPVGVQLDGMVTNETLSMLFCALAIVALPAAVEGARRGKVEPSAWSGLWLGLALVTKVSASALILALIPAVALEIKRSPEPWRQALRARCKPFAVGATIVIALSGWFFVRNQILYGRMAPTGYDGILKPNQAPYEKIPYLSRRPLAFFWRWDSAIFSHPYVPTGTRPQARFFPVLVASTFSDYYSYCLAALEAKTPVRSIHYRPVPVRAFELSRYSVMGGTVIALLTLLAWFGAVNGLRRRPGDPRTVLLIIPLLALLGQMHFATKYPNDDFGPIKGAYMQFVAPILCGLFGLAVAWMWRRVWARAGVVAALAALVLVFLYSADCRLPRFGPGASRAALFFSSKPARH